jgi:hypothetical protein
MVENLSLLLANPTKILSYERYTKQSNADWAFGG